MCNYLIQLLCIIVNGFINYDYDDDIIYSWFHFVAPVNTAVLLITLDAWATEIIVSALRTYIYETIKTVKYMITFSNNDYYYYFLLLFNNIASLITKSVVSIQLKYTI